MMILAGIVAFYTALIYAWSKKPRLTCRGCELPLTEGSDKFYCVGCLVEQDMKGNQK